MRRAHEAGGDARDASLPLRARSHGTMIARSMKPADDLAPIEVGRYAMYAAIGTGGMATVHLGRLAGDHGFGRTVAIKRLRPHLLGETKVVRSFVDEARLATRVRHPNVVATLDVVTSDGEVFLVMDYVEGESLSALVRRAAVGKPIPPAIAVAIVANVLHGLHAAHEAVSESGEPLNIVHRDVSPQNVLVGIDGVSRVLDFGVAKALGRQSTTRDCVIKGKLSYMAPEQVSGYGVTRRTDLFAVGILLWELLTGRRLFHGNDERETVAGVLFKLVPAPSEVCPTAPATVDPIVLRALQRDPIKRFTTAAEMSEALEEALTPAASRAVGEWVREVAANELTSRARFVRDIEHHSTTGQRPVQADRRADPIEVEAIVTAADVATHPRRRSVVLVVAACLGIAALGSVWSIRRRPIAPVAPASTNPAPSADIPASAASLSPPISSVDPPAAAAPAVASPSPTPRATAQTAAKPAPRAIPAGSARTRLYSRD
jgi:eukaryotic-like serine/threonine-protein kinase